MIKKEAKIKYPIDPWRIVENGVCADGLREAESVFSLGNGFIGLRGNLEEPMSGAKSMGGSYLNGVYESAPITYGEAAYGYAKNSQTICNVADAKSLTIVVEGEVLDLGKSRISGHQRVLDMRAGTLTRSFVWDTATGCRLSVIMERLVSLDRLHVAAVRCRVRALSQGGRVEILSGIQPGASTAGDANDPRTAAGKDNQIKTIDSGVEDSVLWMLQQTHNSGQRVCCAAAHSLSAEGCATVTESIQAFRQVVCAELAQGQEIVLEKHIAYTGEQEAADARSQALAHCKTAAKEGFSTLLRMQEAHLARFWQNAYVEIDGDDAILQGLRFNLFHLLQSTGRDGKTNIAAKGLTGEGYEGHYFWDTEIYILPLFLYTDPSIARKLLEYRYAILDDARARAWTMGHPKGALFPWRTIGGDECSAYYPAGTAQYHINADIAYAVGSYLQATGDMDFLAEYGAEILAETARLWVDLGFFSHQKDGRFCIQCVTGPDEYNVLVDNNIYTNMMAARNLLLAAWALDQLKENLPERYGRLCKKIGLDPAEPGSWEAAGKRIYLPSATSERIYPQDEHFLERKPWPLSSIPEGNFPLLLHYHPLVIYRHQICKQADLVLAMLLLSEQFTLEEKKANFAYYDSITTHDSSLSMAVFSILASEIGERSKAYQYFLATARLDLDDLHGNTKDGLHMANMAGTWLCFAQGFGGLRLREGKLCLAPYLPQSWQGYRFRIRYQGRSIEVEAGQEETTLRLIQGEPVHIVLYGAEARLSRECPVCVSGLG